MGLRPVIRSRAEREVSAPLYGALLPVQRLIVPYRRNRPPKVVASSVRGHGGTTTPPHPTRLGGAVARLEAGLAFGPAEHPLAASVRAVV